MLTVTAPHLVSTVIGDRSRALSRGWNFLVSLLGDTSLSKPVCATPKDVLGGLSPLGTSRLDMRRFTLLNKPFIASKMQIDRFYLNSSVLSREDARV